MIKKIYLLKYKRLKEVRKKKKKDVLLVLTKVVNFYKGVRIMDVCLKFKTKLQLRIQKTFYNDVKTKYNFRTSFLPVGFKEPQNTSYILSRVTLICSSLTHDVSIWHTLSVLVWLFVFTYFILFHIRVCIDVAAVSTWLRGSVDEKKVTVDNTVVPQFQTNLFIASKNGTLVFRPLTLSSLQYLKAVYVEYIKVILINI